MDHVREYKSFISSYYFAEGLRVTFGVTLPAIIFNHFGLLPIGLVASMGALCVSVSDIPGPALARKNGMIGCLALISVVALITGLAAGHPVALGILIAVNCFVLSMIGVYGARLNSIGVAGLLIMVLGLYHKREGWDIIYNAGYVAAGGLWYLLFSMALYRFRPYRLVQQVLGDSIRSIADYLRSRAQFYRTLDNYAEVYTDVMAKQVQVQQKQLLVRELLFKSRNIVKESTTTSRTLLMIFTDTVDLFETASTAFYSYEQLHKVFDESGILFRFEKEINLIADELDRAGIAIQMGTTSQPPERLREQLDLLKADFVQFARQHRTPENLDAFISLSRIMHSMDDIAKRIYTLHQYTKYDKRSAAKFKPSGDYDKFVTRTDLDTKHVFDNLTLNSHIFRHALRVSLAVTVGYLLSFVVTVGHSYWILLTIIVILKPAYSASRVRNFQRISGTVGGAILGFGILYFIKDKTALFVLMIFLMIASYSFMRTRYLISVFFMTPFVFILFFLLGTQDFQPILTERIIDTAIGSAIAFLASFLLVPAWEYSQMRGYMTEALSSSHAYFSDIAARFGVKQPEPATFKLSRKTAFVSLANLSEAFTRMLAEPKSKQRHGKEAHQFVVLIHMLNSHIATLSHLATSFPEEFRSKDFDQLAAEPIKRLQRSQQLLANQPDEEKIIAAKPLISQRVDALMAQRRDELRSGITDTDTRQQLSVLKPVGDQFLFISGIANDLEKLSAKIAKVF